jgi:CO/xanthine dehydrogenase FAD-binding subunit
MKPAPFTYHRPERLDEALELLAELAPAAKVLAGGQSLLPVLSMRLAAPEHLVDIGRLRELAYLRTDADGVQVGALARHADLERSAEAAAIQPVLRQAVRLVAHPAIRNRGTVVGSIVHADPAAELPAVLALSAGTVVAASVRGRREIPAAAFALGPMETALAPDELAVEVVFPAAGPGTGTAFLELSRRHGDYALCAVGALVSRHRARVAFAGMSAVPVALDVPVGDWAAAAELAVAATDPEPDLHASAEYRRHLGRVLAARALTAAAAAIGVAA